MSRNNVIHFPPLLKKGDTVAITCPSGYLEWEKVLPAQNQIISWGYKCIIDDTVGNDFHYFSGTDEERLQGVQKYLDDPNVNAILMGRGGYGLSRIIDRLDFTLFKQFPKWIAGFSDITVLHGQLHQLGFATLHSPMCSAFDKNNVADPFIQSINQMWSQYAPEIYPVVVNGYHRSGYCKGQLVGGNLAMLAHLVGSESDIDTEGKILFIEDVGEYLYSIDRMMQQLRRSGKLKGIIGLICGSFTDVQDTVRPLGMDIYQIIGEAVRDLSIPVCFDFPAGHQKDNYTLKLGAVYQMEIQHQKARITIETLNQVI